MRFQLELSIDDKAIGGLAEQVRQVVEKTIADQLAKIKFEAPQLTEAAKSSKPPVVIPEGVDLSEVERLKATDLPWRCCWARSPRTPAF